MNLSELLGTNKIVSVTGTPKDGSGAELTQNGDAFAESVSTLAAGEDAPKGDSSSLTSKDGAKQNLSDETSEPAEEVEADPVGGLQNTSTNQFLNQQQALDPSAMSIAKPDTRAQTNASGFANEQPTQTQSAAQTPLSPRTSIKTLQASKTATLQTINGAAAPIGSEAGALETPETVQTDTRKPEPAPSSARMPEVTTRSAVSAENSANQKAGQSTVQVSANQSQVSGDDLVRQARGLQQPTSSAISAAPTSDASIYSRAVATSGNAAAGSQDGKLNAPAQATDQRQTPSPVQLDSSIQQPSDPAIDDQLAEQRRGQRRDDVVASDQKSEQNRLNQAVPPSQSRQAAATLSFGNASTGPIAVDGPQVASTSADASVNGLAGSSRDGLVERAAALNLSRAVAAERVGQNTVSQIAAAIRNKPLMQMVELTLDPPELGRIEIQMEVAEVGLKATLSAERSTTGDLIRRQADLLLQQLDDAGFSDVDLDFRDFGSGKDGRSDSNQTASGNTSERADATTSQVPTMRTSTASVTNGMDVRL